MIDRIVISMKMRLCFENRKGFLMTLEVIVALVLIFSLVVTFFGNMLFKREEVKIMNLAGIGEEGLTILDEYGTLEEEIYDEDYNGLNDSLRFVLPTNIGYNFVIYNTTDMLVDYENGGTIGTSANVIYFLYGEEELDPRRIDLVLWYIE